LEIKENNTMDVKLSDEEKFAHNKNLQLDIINIINNENKSKIAEAYKNTDSIEVESTKKELNKKRKFENI
jgi:hypothetical protein